MKCSFFRSRAAHLARFLALFFALSTAVPSRAQPEPPSLPGAPGARRLSYREAVTIALENADVVAIADLGIEAAQARVRVAGRQRLPVLRLEGNVQYWDKALEVNFAGGTSAGAPTPPMAGMSAGGLVVRERTTAQATVSLVQPISGLLVLHHLVNVEQAGLDQSRSERTRAGLDAAQRASEAYLRLLQAQALAQIAAKSVAQVEAQLVRAQVLEKAGAMGQVDVLRLTSARDSARQGQLRAQAGVEVAARGLVLALRLPAATPVAVSDDFPDPPPPLTTDEGRVVDQVLRGQPDVALADQRLAQARAGTQVAKAALLPNLLGLLSYQRTEGQSVFMPKNAWFVGATLSWDVWDWGKTWNGVSEARARAQQAEIAARSTRDNLVFEAQRRLIEARTAYQAVDLARSARDAAEEAYRIQSVRYAEGAATTTDVIDAETDVSRARSSYTQARYDYYLAQAAVARAVGQLPVSQGPRAPASVRAAPGGTDAQGR